MFAITAAALAFAPPSCSRVSTNEAAVSRRALFSQVAGVAAAALATPAFADGANSATTAFRARSIYGSRIFKLKGASTDKIVEEKNAFTLFITGTYRTLDQKETKTALTKLSKSIQASAEKGDSAKAQSLLGDFLKLGKIDEDYVSVKGANFNPTQRRNPGAPETAAIEAQMGTAAYSLYAPLPGQTNMVK